MFEDTTNNLTDADFVGLYLHVRDTGGGLKKLAELTELSVEQVRYRIRTFEKVGVNLPPISRRTKLTATAMPVVVADSDIDVRRLNDLIYSHMISHG